jgi:tetratricopeptide (TPR) repeat protein
MKNNHAIFKFIFIHYLIILLLLFPMYENGDKVFAQDKNIDKMLVVAENSYREGQFDEAINLITQCLKNKGITPDQEKTAYRLMGLTYIAIDYLREAKASIKKLLELVPNYKPDPVYDPPPFVEIVEEVKGKAVMTLPEEKMEEKKSSKKWWWIGSGITAAAAVLIIAFWPDDPPDEELPGPPGRP